MFIGGTPNPYPGEKWGFDNGAFAWWLKGQSFKEKIYLNRLDRAYARGVPYLAVTPDIVAGGRNSLEFSLKWLDRLPQDWPWYLAVQDGMQLKEVEGILPKFAGIFLGGTNSFKATAWHWRQLAHNHGKLFHYGRAGTPRKVFHAMEVGSDSSDSAFPLWSFERMAIFIQAVNTGDRQLKLFDPKEYAKCP